MMVLISMVRINPGKNIASLHPLLSQRNQSASLTPASPQAADKPYLHNRVLTIENPCNHLALYIVASNALEEVLRDLENNGYLQKSEILPGKTSRELLQEILNEAIINAVESVARKWDTSDFVGAQVIFRTFIKDSNICFEVLDNGFGFIPEQLPNVGKKPISAYQLNEKDGLSLGGIEDHLYKTNEIVSKLGWELTVSNRKDTEGACVCIKILYLEES